MPTGPGSALYSLSLHDALPICFDVASAQEMRHALDTPTPASRISFAGPGKTGAELSCAVAAGVTVELESERDRKSTRLNSSHVRISYAVFCLKKKISTSTSRPT